MDRKKEFSRLSRVIDGFRELWEKVLDMVYPKDFELKVLKIFVFVFLAGAFWYAPVVETWDWFMYPFWYIFGLCFAVMAIGKLLRWVDEVGREGESDDDNS